MKKYFTENAFRNFNSKRSGTAIVRLRKSKQRKKQKAEEKKRQDEKHRAPDIELRTSSSSKKEKKYKDLVSPNQLSCIDNPDNTLPYISKIKHHCRERHPMHMNMNDIEDVSVDALLAIISVIKNYSQNKNRKLPIRGNLPKNKTAQKAITDSGFFEILKAKSSYDLSPANQEIFTIHSGNKCDTQCVAKIIAFIESCYSNIHTHELQKTTKLIYKFILEFMGNAHEHAYKGNSDYIQSWYLSAEKKNNYISFTLLDNGSGMANTIRHAKWDVARAILKSVTDWESPNKIKDYVLIEAAFLSESGERSQTGLSYRGKGLPCIFSLGIASNVLKKFTVISNKAYVKFDEKGVSYTKSLKESFVGTLYYWEVSPGGENQ